MYHRDPMLSIVTVCVLENYVFYRMRERALKLLCKQELYNSDIIATSIICFVGA